MVSSFSVNAPGRVNIIGEHVDHQGYGVMPAATSQAINFKCKTCRNGPALRVCFEGDYSDIEIMRWGDLRIEKDKRPLIYIVSAFVGLLKYLGNGRDYQSISQTNYDNVEELIKIVTKEEPSFKLPESLLIRISSDLPSAAGLSSSSALICGCLQVLIIAFGLNENKSLNDRAVLSNIARHAERLSGTFGGGMDQAIIFMAKKNCALQVDFNPLRSGTIILPEKVRLIVAHSCRESEKCSETWRYYNKRVAELRLANLLILYGGSPHLLNDINEATEDDNLQLKEVAARLGLDDSTNNSIDRLLAICSSLPTVLSREEIPQKFGIKFLTSLSKMVGYKVLESNEYFIIRDRVEHVLSEVKRVNEFVLETKKEEPDANNLGLLINQAYYSMRNKFMASCYELDQIHNVAMEAGALGARVVGAGWGGSMLVMCRKEKVESVMRALKVQYYEKQMLRELEGFSGTKVTQLTNNGASLAKVMFVTRFGPGLSYSVDSN